MTNRDLAKHLGISPAALSLILNHKSGVSHATRKRVLAQLQEMGYGHLIKEPLPPSNTSPQQGQLCYVLYQRDGHRADESVYSLLLLENISSRARKHGYTVFLFSITLPGNDVDEKINELNSSGARGALIYATDMSLEDLALLRHLSMPFVVMDHAFDTVPISSVAIDNSMGTEQAVAHLAGLGHKHIGYLKSEFPVSSFDERHSGYRSALERRHLPADPTLIYTLPNSEGGSYQVFSKALREGAKLPTAFVTDDDSMALGVIRALMETGIRVPEDISLVGYNDRPTCQQSVPPLTTIRVPVDTFAEEGVDMLIREIGRRDKNLPLRPLKLRVGTELVLRSSTAPANE